jgi:hypothetical protein
VERLLGEGVAVTRRSWLAADGAAGQTEMVAESTAAAMQPRAVLFDSGGVLVQPIGGRWNPRADFELSRDPSITPRQFAAAIASGDEFMATAPSTRGRDDYHRVILRHLGVRPDPELLAELRRPVAPTAFLETFPEVPETLRELRRRGVPMAVVSDACPGCMRGWVWAASARSAIDRLAHRDPGTALSARCAALAFGRRIEHRLDVQHRGAVERFERADLDAQPVDGEDHHPVQADRVGPVG